MKRIFTLDSTLFQGASISKPVFTMAVLKLAEQGVLDIDADVNTLLTSWKLPENEFTTTEKVTLKRLLGHVAGTTVHGFGGYAPTAPLLTLVNILNGEAPANSPPPWSWIRHLARPGATPVAAIAWPLKWCWMRRAVASPNTFRTLC